LSVARRVRKLLRIENYGCMNVQAHSEVNAWKIKGRGLEHITSK